MGGLKSLLLKKFQAQRLGHFYELIAPYTGAKNPQLSSLLLEEWSKDLCLQMSQLAHAYKGSLINHPDLLFLSSSHESKDYTLKDFAPFFDFLTQKALQLPMKIVVIKEAHKIRPLLGNKLLKLLEEPPIPMLIFFLNSERMPLLPTLSSRALTLRLTQEDLGEVTLPLELEDEELQQEVLSGLNEYLETKRPSKMFMDLIKESPAQDYFLSLLLEKQTQHPHFLKHQQFLEEWKWFFKAKSFQNPVLERMIGLLLTQ